MREDRSAEEVNEEGRRFAASGDVSAAEVAYRAAMALDPAWSVPVYNLGLLYKYNGDWERSLHYNVRAVELSPEDRDSWWNLGIAATALGQWARAREAWQACGITPPPGDGAPDFNWGQTPVRLDPHANAEVVWARRIDPARAEIANIPVPTSRFRWRDIVLTDGAVQGQRIVDGRTFPVFDALELLSASEYETVVVELGTANDAAIDALDAIAAEAGVGCEYWGLSTRILCRACSLGLPDEHTAADAPAAHPHVGLGVRDASVVGSIIDRWLASCPSADLVRYYPVPRAS